MSSVIESSPAREVDPSGRLMPIGEAELRRRADRLRALAAEAKASPEDPKDDARWRDAARGIDAERPHRPLFGGLR
jgi:hypothetical protein